ncbi:hypothetical protein J6590_093649 [Homalodisca vitripennis]|nr:hypothetical protein J6590_093649 [Homalodisca vitripennis]
MQVERVRRHSGLRQRNCTGVVTWLSYQPYQRKTPELYPPSDKIFHSSIENGLKNATDG